MADATHHAISSPFNITVVGPASGVATLEWEQPLSKVDGSPLDDLAGYRIVYGRNPEDLDHSVFIDDPAQTSYEFATLSSGVWYFAVIARERQRPRGAADHRRHEIDLTHFSSDIRFPFFPRGSGMSLARVRRIHARTPVS